MKYNIPLPATHLGILSVRKSLGLALLVEEKADICACVVHARLQEFSPKFQLEESGRKRAEPLPGFLPLYTSSWAVLPSEPTHSIQILKTKQTNKKPGREYDTKKAKLQKKPYRFDTSIFDSRDEFHVSTNESRVFLLFVVPKQNVFVLWSVSEYDSYSL